MANAKVSLVRLTSTSLQDESGMATISGRHWQERENETRMGNGQWNREILP
jgi:hypothetical protein